MMAVAHDPFSAEAYSAALREERPAYWAESSKASAVSRFPDVSHVVKMPELFASSVTIDTGWSPTGSPRTRSGTS